MSGKLRVTLVKSAIARPERQKQILKGLGLTKLHRTVELNDTAPIRGMIVKVQHLVRLEPAGVAKK